MRYLPPRLLVALALAMAGCTNAATPPGTPGTLTAHLHGTMGFYGGFATGR